MTEHLFFDGVDLNDFGALPVIGNIYAAPERIYTSVEVPGRSGALIIDDGQMGNVGRSWDVVFSGPLASGNAARLRTFLMSKPGYRRIEDTLHKDEFYLGAFRGALENGIKDTVRFIQYALEFDCRPQRFLKVGEQVRTFTAAGAMENPEPTTAKPLIRVYGAGDLTVNGKTVTVAAGANEYVDLDSETEDAYCGAVNCNGLVTLADFPILVPGENIITPGAGITRVEIKPRWWRL